MACAADVDGRLIVVAAGIVVLTGTIVTLAAGPHGGDEDVDRLPVQVPDVARIHGISVILLLVLVVTTLVVLRRSDAPTGVVRRLEILLVVLLAQGTVGYVQYFTGVPVVLVGIIAGATAVWIAALSFHLGLFQRPAEPEVGEVTAPAATAAALARA